MIKSFTITNHLGESLELILADPDSSGLAVMSVTGLGQVSADVNLTDLAGSDYHTVNSAKLTKRNIVFKVKYWGNDIEESRHLADKFFPVQKTIKIVIHTDHRDLETSGIVEKNEPDIFSNKTTGQISILCGDPFLYDTTEATVEFGGVEPRFETPFPSVDEYILDENNIETFEIGNIRLIKDKNIYYKGEADVGLTITIDAVGSVRNLAFYCIDHGKTIKFDDNIIASITGGDSISAGDRIILSTNKGGKKFAKLIRAGGEFNIINAVVKPIEWFVLERGDNLFSYSASEGEYEMAIRINYKTAFKGI